MGRRLRTIPALIASRRFIPRWSTRAASSASGSTSTGGGSSRLLAGLERCAGYRGHVGVGVSMTISRGCARKGLVSTVRRCASSGRCHGRLRELLLLLVRGLDGRQSDAGDGFLCRHRIMDGR